MNSLFDGEEFRYLFIDSAKQNLNDKFIIPPFSTFDTRQGYWQNRKDKWKALGIKSELGRDAQTFHMKDWADKKGKTGELSGNKLPSDTSIFDPTLCEICYKWFNVDGGKILDPFAGGSVRGIVANVLDYEYLGIDLSERQIEANYENAKEVLCDMTKLKWINDDSINVDKYVDDESVDMIFTCPPYYDLEIYSDKENDLSNMSFEDFKKAYTVILKKCFKKLKDNRFGIIVIGDVRDKNGYYRNLIDITKSAICCEKIGFYNDIILLNSLASASLRAEGQFKASRKVVKVHQNVLVFYKGNVKEIKNNFKEITGV
ncbi:MAG: hypothetical protein IKV94_02585 [Clostridia bacterium]|nr:hypothetical protein [Clostridia bacterium]MBR6517097.1 hypothetical protein [Bacilli bacterium]